MLTLAIVLGNWLRDVVQPLGDQQDEFGQQRLEA